MTQQGRVTGKVCFRAGDGVLMPIPVGPLEIDMAPDSATLSWTASDGSAGSAAIPRDEYERHVREGSIQPGAA
jgi:hypothetical protein